MSLLSVNYGINEKVYLLIQVSLCICFHNLYMLILFLNYIIHVEQPLLVDVGFIFEFPKFNLKTHCNVFVPLDKFGMTSCPRACNLIALHAPSHCFYFLFFLRNY